MKNSHFYIGLSVLNIILFICIYVTLFIYSIIFMLPDGRITLICWGILLVLKIFFLYIIFKISKKYFPKSRVCQIENELKINPNRRKFALILAFVYDLIAIFPFVYPDLTDVFFIFEIYLIYAIVTLLGIYGFYLTLFFIWEIRTYVKKKVL